MKIISKLDKEIDSRLAVIGKQKAEEKNKAAKIKWLLGETLFISFRGLKIHYDRTYSSEKGLLLTKDELVYIDPIKAKYV